MNLSNKKVLVIDDVKYIQILIREALKRYHISTHAAGDYEEADFLIKRNVYDLLIVDNNLPVKKGIEIARESIQESRVHDVLLISAFIDRDLIRTAYKYGIQNIMLKPLNMKEFLDKVVEILNGKETTGVKDITPGISSGGNGKKKNKQPPAREEFTEGAMITVKANEDELHTSPESVLYCEVAEC